MNNYYLPAYAMLDASRKELDTTLQILEGTLPEDIYGYVFFNSPVGHEHSQGLPYPEQLPDGSDNPEYGTPIFNGDGMVHRIHFNKNGQVELKTRISKTPDFYADKAMPPGSKYHKEKKRYKNFAFNNGGLTRLSFTFGVRNQLNTAIVPFKLKGENNTRLLVTFDSGRPYEYDPKTMELLHPIGYNTTWRPSEPSFTRYIFPVVMSTSHPSFDARTREFYTVNFCPDYSKILSRRQILNAFSINFSKFFKKKNKITDRGNGTNLFKRLSVLLKKAVYQIQANVSHALGNDEHGYKPNLFLLKWAGGQEIKRFRIVDDEGLPIVISQSMHQMGYTKDYIILMDTSFKMSLSVMMNNPFPKNARLSRFIRKLTTRTMRAKTTAFIIKRSDLTESNTDVKAVRLKDPIPIECVHFSTEYNNPNGQITLLTTHNNALCLAEWTREYDRKVDNPKEAIPRDQIGMYNGAMDVSGIGKFVIDAATGKIEEEKILRETGDTKAIDNQDYSNIGANTWSSGLYTYAGLDSPEPMEEPLRYVYWQNLGLDDKMLTDFIAYLYKDYPHRIIEVDKIKEWVKKGIPGQIICVDTHTMDIVDHYQLPLKCQNRSIQFVPKKGFEHQGSHRNGYLLITVLHPSDTNSAVETYTRELWILDANDLSKGVICKLGAKDWIFTYTIHSAWLPSVESPQQPAFDYNIRDDYDWRIQRVGNKQRRADIQAFMDEFVYPHFEHKTVEETIEKEELVLEEVV